MISIGTRGIAKTCTQFRDFPATSINTVAAAMLRYTWTPAIFEEGRRCLANWLCADYVALDFDGEMLLADAIERFDGVGCIGTTRSHRMEKKGIVSDRFRVVLRLQERCASIDDYRETLRYLCDKYDTDPKCVDPAHLYFPCTEIVQVNEEGELEPIRPAKLRKKLDLSEYARVGVLTRDARRVLYCLVQKGERNNLFFRAAKDLARSGLTEQAVMALLAGCPTQKSEFALGVIEMERTVLSAFDGVRREYGQAKTQSSR